MYQSFSHDTLWKFKMDFSLEIVKRCNNLLILALKDNKVPRPHHKCAEVWTNYYEYGQGLAVHYRNVHPTQFTQSLLKQAKDLRHNRQHKLTFMFLGHRYTTFQKKVSINIIIFLKFYYSYNLSNNLQALSKWPLSIVVKVPDCDIYQVNHYDINNKKIKYCGVHIKNMFTLN